MKLVIKRTLALVLVWPSILAVDKSCFDDGWWQGDEIEPDGSTSYPEEKKLWDLSDEEYDSQPGICESIRIIMGGVDWTMDRENDKAECRVLSRVTGSEENSNNIKSITCTYPPAHTLSSPSSPGSTWSPTLFSSKMLTRHTPTTTPTPSTNSSMFDTGTKEHPTAWYWIICVVLFALLYCLMIVAHCWMVNREEYIEEKHAKGVNIFESLRNKMSSQERVPDKDGVQLGSTYTKWRLNYNRLGMNSTARTLSNASVFSNRSSRLQYSTGRTIWTGSIDDCSMDDEEAVNRRFLENQISRDLSERRTYSSYSGSKVKMMATPPFGSGRLLNRGFLSKNYNSLIVHENPNHSTFNMNKVLKTGVVNNAGSMSYEDSRRSTTDDTDVDKNGWLLSKEDASHLTSVKSTDENSEPSTPFINPTEIGIEVNIRKQEAPILEGLDGEEEEDERMDASNKEVKHGQFSERP